MNKNNSITTEIIKSHGLTAEEYNKILEIQKREPNLTELGIFSVMWSEHCSYKSTRLHLAKLHTKEEFVICGPGENAGIIDVEDDDAIIFKMESHNHPSFIEPYQGSATGVGGIMRDVFTMGARPIAILDSLRFGDYNNAKTKFLLNGVAAGISGYGNCVGVPNIAGDTIFDSSYNGNILVNAMCIGHAKKDKIFYSAASQIGSKILYVGSKTGRDGIHGATMASQEFSESSAEKRPTVQVGDPFKEKLLIEACLELMQEDAIIAIQDMGAAGLTSSSIEMSAKGGTGIEINLDLVPVREENMSAYEIMLSESQERMLMVIKPNKENLAKEIFSKWDLDCSIIGEITDTKRLILKHNLNIVADIPVDPLAESAPKYNRKWQEPKIEEFYEYPKNININIINSLKKIIANPDIASKHQIYEQYDHGVMNDTIKSHNIAGGIVKIHGTNKAIAATTDCTPRYVEANPYQGAMQAVCESYRNLIILGAKPMAITNCLNFGNPEKAEIMGQIVKSIEGIRDASKYLKYPVVSGNVSLYNETNNQAIKPCPNIGAVGLIKNIKNIPKNYFSTTDHSIFVIGETKSEMGRTIFQKEILNEEYGNSPQINLETEKNNSEFITKLIMSNLISAVNDISDGGLLTILTKMSFFENIGFKINPKINNLSKEEFYFSETQARYIIATNNEEKIIKIANELNIHLIKLGNTIKSKIIINEEEIEISQLKKIYLETIKL
jgi:phosphoribosylformylglycinamidine synthase II